MGKEGAMNQGGESPPNVPSIWTDYNMRTCLVVRKEGGEVRLIMTAPQGVLVYETSERSFEQRFKEIPYEVERAARSYLKTAQLVGASDEALNELSKFIKITEREKEMAKKNLPETKSTSGVATPKTRSSKATEPKDRKPSAAARFQALILEGKLSDDDIFAKVQAEFNLSDDKRRYVAWYRNHLTKHGKNPPVAKETKPVAKAEKKSAKKVK